MNRPHFTLETDARGVARLTLDRPERHNVLAGATCDALAAAAGRINADAAIRVVVLGGTTVLHLAPSGFALANVGLAALWVLTALAIGRRFRQLTASA